MRITPAARLVCLALLCLSLCACAAGENGRKPAITVAAGSTEEPPSPTPSRQPTPSPTPRPPTPSPTPSPSPEPTPTPDPWAGKFFAGGAYVKVKDAEYGPWIYRDAALSVTVRYTRGGPLNRSYYVAEVYTRGPLLARGFAFQSDRGRTELPYRIARRYDAVLGITADYFNHRSNRKGVMLKDGKVYHDKRKNTTLAALPDGSLNAYDPGGINADGLRRLGVKDSFSFGPILVKDGKVDKASIKQHWLPSDTYEYRAAIGQIEPGHYVVIVTKGAFTMMQLAKLFVEYKCTLAYNMDGGHSACMIFMGEQLNHQFPGTTDGVRQRPLPDLMMIGTCPAVPDVKAKVFCDGVNVFYGNKPKPGERVIN